MNSPTPVRAYHVVLTAYGFWLPNDPRGSWSVSVRAQELRRYGPATKVEVKHSLARRPHDAAERRAAKGKLAHTPVSFSGVQAQAIGAGFADYCQRSGCVIHAASILPRHAHLVVARHRYEIERVMELLKGAATAALNARGLHPFAEEPYRNGRLPTPWTRGGWSVFLGSAGDVRRAIRYVEENPVKEGKPVQRWSLVTPFEGSGD